MAKILGLSAFRLTCIQIPSATLGHQRLEQIQE